MMARADFGSAAWWGEVAARGTPLVAANDAGADGSAAVTFLWRAAPGAAPHAVYLDVYSHTPHPSSGPAAMRHHAGTDVWSWETRLPSDWRGSYFLMPVGAERLPPEEGGATALRRWWVGLLESNAQADPLNLRPPHAGGWGQPLSPLLLPQAPVHSAWDRAAAPQGRLHQHRWHSFTLGLSRDSWIYRTAPQAQAGKPPLVLLLDGHYWARQAPLFGALDLLTAQGELPPAVYLLVDAVSPERRAMELPCHAPFWYALQQELLPAVEALEPATSEARHTVVAGQSFGGLAAAYAALNWPERFGNVLSQSGSFWWPDPADTASGGRLAADVANGLGAGAPLRFLLEIGCYEGSMLGPNRSFHQALCAAGHHAVLREVRGGHDWLCWRDGLLEGLCELMKNFDESEQP
ncbi:enterochelin esterase [Pseudoduganella violaceinigra]|uniref:enterochelin esterase n=1 Tax=Pseudoduganella violaceinigra TaxID=246602 RepID=UPI000422D789|nr:enterochelin esterase [Pseudoduganella violaceinigra]